MPNDANPAEQHLAWHRSMSGVPEPRTDARPASLSRRDTTSVRRDSGDGPTPVAGGGSAALLEQTLEEGM